MTTSHSSLDLSIILPILDDAPYLEELLHDLSVGLVRLRASTELIVSDASVQEKVRALAERFGAHYVVAAGTGYGGAAIQGVAVARGKYVMTMDPDAAFPMDAVRRLWDGRESAEVVIASRYLRLSHAEQPLFRSLVSRAMNGFFSFILSTPVKDLSSGYRLYRRDVFDRISLETESLAFLLETVLKFSGNGIAMKEVAFHYKLNNYRMAQAHGLRLAGECFRSLFNLWRMRNSVDCADYDLRAFNSRIPLQRWWQRNRYHVVMGFVEKNVSTIDVGCGSGRIIADLPDAFGVDIRPGKLLFMRRTNRLLAASDGLHLPFPDASFECVISSEVLEHIPDENGRFIDELTRILKPGGALVIGTPDYDSRPWVFFEWLYAKVAPGAYAHEHVTHYTFRTLKQALEDRGYKVLAHGYVFGSIVIFKARRK